MTYLAPVQEGMHPEDIKATIRKRGKTLTQLALDNNLANATVRVALKRPMPAAAKVISDFIGKPLHQIWPDHYDHNDKPIKKGRSKSRRNSNVRHCQKDGQEFTEGGV